MADLIRKKKKQKQLIVILTLVLIVTVFVLWYGFLRPKTALIDVQIEQAPELADPGFKKVVEIDLKLLESQGLKELRSFEEIKGFEGTVGRQNPFIPF